MEERLRKIRLLLLDVDGVHLDARHVDHRPGSPHQDEFAVLDGRGSLAGTAGTQELHRGQGWLLPAASGPLRIAGELRLVLSTFPGSPTPTPGAATAQGGAAEPIAARETTV